MVWIAPEVGSHFRALVMRIPRKAAAHNSARVSGDDFRNNLQMAPDPHQEGFREPTIRNYLGLTPPAGSWCRFALRCATGAPDKGV